MTTQTQQPSSSAAAQAAASTANLGWLIALAGATLGFLRQLTGNFLVDSIREGVDTAWTALALALTAAGMLLVTHARQRIRQWGWYDFGFLLLAAAGFAWLYPSLTEDIDRWTARQQLEAAIEGAAIAAVFAALLMLVLDLGSQPNAYRVFGLHGLLILAGEALCPTTDACGLGLSMLAIAALVWARVDDSWSTFASPSGADTEHRALSLLNIVTLVFVVLALLLFGFRDELDSVLPGLVAILVAGGYALWRIVSRLRARSKRRVAGEETRSELVAMLDDGPPVGTSESSPTEALSVLGLDEGDIAGGDMAGEETLPPEEVGDLDLDDLDLEDLEDEDDDDLDLDDLDLEDDDDDEDEDLDDEYDDDEYEDEDLDDEYDDEDDLDDEYEDDDDEDEDLEDEEDDDLEDEEDEDLDDEYEDDDDEDDDLEDEEDEDLDDEYDDDLEDEEDDDLEDEEDDEYEDEDDDEDEDLDDEYEDDDDDEDEDLDDEDLEDEEDLDEDLEDEEDLDDDLEDEEAGEELFLDLEEEVAVAPTAADAVAPDDIEVAEEPQIAADIDVAEEPQIAADIDVAEEPQIIVEVEPSVAAAAMAAPVALGDLLDRDGVSSEIDGIIAAAPEPGSRPLVALVTVGSAQTPELTDALLSEVATRLAAVGGDGHTLARVADDEFVLVARNHSDDSAQELADSVEAALADPIDLDGSPTSASTATGITAPNADDDGTDAALIRARVALYEARGKGDNSASAWIA